MGCQQHTGLQRKKTLSTLQSLYERHKIVTYPRTDSHYISQDIVPTLKDRLKALLGSRYKDKVKELLDSDLNPGIRFVDGGKVTDHPAIISIGQKANPDTLDVVLQHFIADLSTWDERDFAWALSPFQDNYFDVDPFLRKLKDRINVRTVGKIEAADKVGKMQQDDLEKLRRGSK